MLPTSSASKVLSAPSSIMPGPWTTSCWWHSAPSARIKRSPTRTRPQLSTNYLTVLLRTPMMASHTMQVP
eukprot:CCRYP_007355-RB/>CCRYP_007355-RB protein AED:0.48 eAED:1.00 QI:0/-1/0/1/-1/0/1/0/69